MRIRILVASAAVIVAGVAGTSGVAAAQEQPAGGEAEKEITHASEECIHLLEEGGKPEDCHEAPSPIIPETKEIVWGSISFVVLFVLMRKFAYPAIKQGMEARTEKIRNNLDEADRVRAEAESILEEYKRQLADAKNESGRIIEEARQTADQLRRDLMQRAEAEVADLRQRTRDDIAAAQQRATADLQARVGALAIDLAEKVVERNLDRDTNLALIDSYINQVGAQRS